MARAPVQQHIESSIQAHLETVALCRQTLVPAIEQAATLVEETLRRGNKVLLCGNGGSAADAQHLAAEFVGRLRASRRPFPAIALSTDTSVLTAVGNDFGFREVFARQVKALAREGDLVIGISTSGNSENVLEAVAQAKQQGAWTIGLTGKGGGKLAAMVDLALCVPSNDTQRVQEAHILIGHLLCELVDASLGAG